MENRPSQSSQSSNVSEAHRTRLNLHHVSLLKDKDNLSDEEIENLLNVGLDSIESILLAPISYLKRILYLTEVKYKYLWARGTELVPLAVSREQFITHSIQHSEFITTGSSNIDRMLKGGIEIGKITEVFGESRAGKSQFCHTLAINCQLPRIGNQFGGRCIYIDTENTFRTSRLESIGGGLYPLENIDYVFASNTSNQFKFIKQADYILTHSLQKAEYENNQMYLRQRVLDEFVNLMRSICIKHNIAIVYSNQVAFDFLNGSNRIVPVGGRVLSKASHTRLQLIYNEDTKERTCKIIASPYLKEDQTTFSIKTIGICDD